MSDDIVRHLRELEKEFSGDEDVFGVFLCVQEAADEIERLRAELRTYTGDKHTTREPFTPEAL